MNKLTKKIIPGIITLVIILTAAKLIPAKIHSSWNDIYEIPSEAAFTPTMTVNQVEASLENVLKQYQGLMTSAKQINKNKMIDDLDKLYQQSANDYNNATAIQTISNKNQGLDDLTQSANLLTASIFEMKDSLITEGDLSSIQLENSKQDLASAIKELERVKQELNLTK